MKRALTASLGVLALAALSVTTTGGQAGAAAVSPAAQHGPESFSIMSTTDPSTGTIIATGLFTAGGTDQSGASADVITFADGTFTIDHTGTGKSHLDKLTCLLTTVGSGTYTFTAGTGAYAGISGSGSYTYNVDVVFLHSKSGGCKGHADPAALEYLVVGHGHAALP